MNDFGTGPFPERGHVTCHREKEWEVTPERKGWLQKEWQEKNRGLERTIFYQTERRGEIRNGTQGQSTACRGYPDGLEFSSFRLQPGRKTCIPINAYLILGGETPILVDTGVRDVTVFPPIMKGWSTPEQDLIKLLKKRGSNLKT